MVQRVRLITEEEWREERRGMAAATVLIFAIMFVGGFFLKYGHTIWYFVGGAADVLFWLAVAYFSFKYAFRLLLLPFKLIRRMVRGY